jgi:hypothetical protein
VLTGLVGQIILANLVSLDFSLLPLCLSSANNDLVIFLNFALLDS